MKPDPLRPETVLGFDILGPRGSGELVGGGQRVDSLDYLLAQLDQHALPQEAFEWYLDLRRYGSVPHAGFGVGLERTVAWICGSHHIRETIPFPRMLYHLQP
jgi:asparaginyl-tRNA synthetase